MKIGIIVESERDFAPIYQLHAMAGRWRTMGMTVALQKIDDTPQALDLRILHIDRTRIEPGRIAPHLALGPVLNGSVLDISKHLISQQQCSRGDDYHGPVLIKTNDNHGGAPERARGLRKRGIPLKLMERYPALTPHLWKLARTITEAHYPELPKDEVPDWVWESGDYVVERFTPERDGDFFIARSWDFFMDAEYGTIRWAPEYQVKGANTVRMELTSEVPEELRYFRRLLNFDYGKFDYVLTREGRPVLLDVNKTTTLYPNRPDLPDILAMGLCNCWV